MLFVLQVRYDTPGVNTGLNTVITEGWKHNDFPLLFWRLRRPQTGFKFRIWRKYGCIPTPLIRFHLALYIVRSPHRSVFHSVRRVEYRVHGAAFFVHPPKPRAAGAGVMHPIAPPVLSNLQTVLKIQQPAGL